MAEMIAVRNGSGEIIGWQPVKYVEGKAVVLGTAYGTDGREIRNGGDIVQRTRASSERRNWGGVNKNDTESGMTPSQARLVNEIEGQIAKKRKEAMYIVDEQGRLIGHSSHGGKANVSTERTFGMIQHKDLSNVYITHNHPATQWKQYGLDGVVAAIKSGEKVDGYNSKTIGGRLGTSLSHADVYVAAKHNVKGIRARSGDYLYSIERTGKNWGAEPMKLRTEIQEAHARHTERLLEHTRSRSRTSNDMKEGIGRANALASHLCIKEVARKYGLKYTRRRVR